MNLESLKEPLGERFAEVEQYVTDLINQRDAVRTEEATRRRASKAKTEQAEALIARLMEKLGIESSEELDALPPAKGQAEALKQLEARLKAKDTALAEKEQALSDLTARYRHSKVTAELDRALSAYEFVDRDLVATHLRQSLDWEDDRLVFKTDKGDISVDDGVKGFAEAKPHLIKASGAKGSGYNPNGRAGEVANPWAKASFNLTEQLRLVDEKPALAAQLKAAAGIA